MKLAKACTNPGLPDYEALLHLLGYIRKYNNYGLKYYSNICDSPVDMICLEHNINHTEITGFSDASYMDCPDTRRSTIGYKIFYRGGLIEWSSSLPIPIANSSAESEYMAACSACMSMTHLSMLIYDLDNLGKKDYDPYYTPRDSPNILMVDNSATVKMAQNFKPSKYTRHIERRFHYVRYGQKEKKHKLIWIPAKDQLADDLTKIQDSTIAMTHMNRTLSLIKE